MASNRSAGSERATVRALPGARQKRNSRKQGDSRYLIERENCFGVVEQLDPLSVNEALDGEDDSNKQLEDFLNDVARSTAARSKASVTQKTNKK